MSFPMKVVQAMFDVYFLRKGYELALLFYVNILFSTYCGANNNVINAGQI